LFSLHQLRCFLATYEHGSLTAAAEQLGYAQPSLSEQVRSLENRPASPDGSAATVPTTVADVPGPTRSHLAAADEARRAAARSGARPYNPGCWHRPVSPAALIADVLERTRCAWADR
jgi:hypothetical protein